MNDLGSFNQQQPEENYFHSSFQQISSYPQEQFYELPPPVNAETHNYYSYYSDSTPVNNNNTHNDMFSSPQLKPRSTLPFQRKRFKTVATYPGVPTEPLFPNRQNTEPKDDAELTGDKDDDSDSEDESNNESGESNKKRGKYKIYTEAEKNQILEFMMLHGTSKTLEIFSNEHHKITKRKLKSWIESQTKIKGVKGRKTNDPNRDHTLYDWCVTFQREHNRAPTRKEATNKALELSEDPSFQASKGWLDKFSRKYNIEFTPLKIIPPKNRSKTGKFTDSDSISTFSDASSHEVISPLLQAMQGVQPQQQGKDIKLQRWNSGSPTMPPSKSENKMEPEAYPMNPFFNFSSQNNFGQMMNEENKPLLQFVDPQVQYFQRPINGTYNLSFGFQNTFQPAYQPNPTPEAYLQFHNENALNHQPNYEINGFLNLEENGNSHNMSDIQMKLEYPY